MAGQPISVEDANAMKDDYVDYMRNLGVDMDHQTQSVSFTKSDLLDYINNEMSDADEIRIFMGRYTSGTHQGRTNVILWPYLNGEPLEGGGGLVEPFNEGEGRP